MNNLPLTQITKLLIRRSEAIQKENEVEKELTEQNIQELLGRDRMMPSMDKDGLVEVYPDEIPPWWFV